MSETFDNKKIIGHYGLQDVDQAFLNWWDQKLNIHLEDKDGNMQKVPVTFFTAERWIKARQAGVRDKNGTLIVPLIIISRTTTTDATDGPTGRRFADTQDVHVIARQADKKSSHLKNLLESRPSSIDPSLPIYEIYTVPVPDHFSLTYEVAIWVPYMEDMNEIMEKVGQEFNYKSKKSFKFDGPNGMYFVALKEDEVNDDSNLDDFSDNERIIRKEYTFKVSAHILPQSNERRDTFKRYFSQSKVVIKNETPLTEEEVKKYFGK